MHTDGLQVILASAKPVALIIIAETVEFIDKQTESEVSRQRKYQDTRQK